MLFLYMIVASGSPETIFHVRYGSGKLKHGISSGAFPDKGPENSLLDLPANWTKSLIGRPVKGGRAVEIVAIPFIFPC
jgi:hypothetical protein